MRTWFMFGPSKLIGADPFLIITSNSSVACARNKGDVPVAMVSMAGDKRQSSVSFFDQLSIQSISIAGDIEPEFKIEQYSNSVASSSVEGHELNLKTQAQSTMSPYGDVDAV